MGSGCCRDRRSKTKQRARTKTWATGTHEWPAFKKRLVIDKVILEMDKMAGVVREEVVQQSVEVVAVVSRKSQLWRRREGLAVVGIPSVISICAAHLKQDKEPMFNGMTLQTETFYSLSLVCSLSWWLWWYLPYKIVPYSDAASRTQQCVGSQQQTEHSITKQGVIKSQN